jgi:hypothetical protein
MSRVGTSAVLIAMDLLFANVFPVAIAADGPQLDAMRNGLRVSTNSLIRGTLFLADEVEA